MQPNHLINDNDKQPHKKIIASPRLSPPEYCKIFPTTNKHYCSLFQPATGFSSMAKRKRDDVSNSQASKDSLVKKNKPEVAKEKVAKPETPKLTYSAEGPLTIQIVAGSYDRVLHGVTAAIERDSSNVSSNKDTGDICSFADTFLFNAHASAIRCLALSPPSAPIPGQAQKVVLASGSSDERINLYNISAHPPSAKSTDEQRILSAIAPRPIRENRNNRELGTLLHHNSGITRLAFPTRSKLLSASEDSSVAVTRTRDWSVLHTFKCPIPKVMGRPSGDTAAHGGAPAGVNDFAVHPSMKVMLSVSKGERCMRLWNLVTGKKARALNFSREILTEVGEGRRLTGEARRIVWGSDGGEDEFAVGFDRDILVYTMDCKPKCRLMGDAKTKVHEYSYVTVDEEKDQTVIAVSTEDGRILFFSTRKEDLLQKEGSEEKSEGLPSAKLIAQLGGKPAGISGRVKDFAVLPLDIEGSERSWYFVAGSSDGILRVWQVLSDDLQPGKEPKQIDRLLGSYETQNRITCVEAFVMIPRPEGAEDSEFEFESEPEDATSDDSEADR